MTMSVFCHHIYEYKKGLRNLVLHTLSMAVRPDVEQKLGDCDIDYLIYPLGENRINIFFGAPDCVKVVRAIGKPSLTDYTPEEDFILGTMLGYDRLLQCRRYLRLLQNCHAFTLPLGRIDSKGDALAAESARQRCDADDAPGLAGLARFPETELFATAVNE
jgi:hypothetical protein